MLIFRRLVGLGFALAAAVSAPSAHAYCRTMSCELGEADRIIKCARDANQCVTDGQPLHWASPCLTYSVQLDGSPVLGLDADQMQALVAEAFAAWQGAHCPGGGSPRFLATFQGYVSCDRHEFVCGGAAKNVNEIMFHDQSWPYNGTQIGVTTPSGGSQSGLVVDADVEVDSRNSVFAAIASDPSRSALRYVLTHELGHFLGLAHSNVDGALMSFGYQSLPLGASLLAADDAAAICAAYPPGQPLICAPGEAPAYDACQLAPGEKPACTISSVSQDANEGCSCRAAPRGRPASLAFGLALLGWAVLRRRSRQNRGPRGLLCCSGDDSPRAAQ